MFFYCFQILIFSRFQPKHHLCASCLLNFFYHLLSNLISSASKRPHNIRKQFYDAIAYIHCPFWCNIKHIVKKNKLPHASLIKKTHLTHNPVNRITPKSTVRMIAKITLIRTPSGCGYGSYLLTCAYPVFI